MSKPVKPPVLVIGVGGNALCPPRGDPSLAAERRMIARAADEIAPLAGAERRLLIVHGNGPQVGRLLAAGGEVEDLDLYVAQTQGELGYLLAEACEARNRGVPYAALVTRVLIDPADAAFRAPDKPVGAVLRTRPDGVAAAPTPDGLGWRRVVPSPRPMAVIEEAAIGALLASHNVVAGGGGGIPLAKAEAFRASSPAVVDKDWVASMLAIAFDAERLLFVTDVPSAFDRFGAAAQEPIAEMSATQAKVYMRRGVFAEGSMRPKVESVLAYVAAAGREAIITTIGAVEAGLQGRAGTLIRP
jgi:carbamate kinase